MKNCNRKLKELIEDVVLADLEDHMDELFAIIAKDKKSNEQYQAQLDELHEMRDEFNEILDEIENKQLSHEECQELYEEIMEMISDESDDEE